jgi:hypothetical protein
MTADMHALLSPYSITAFHPRKNMPLNMTRGTRATAANQVRLHQTPGPEASAYKTPA